MNKRSEKRIRMFKKFPKCYHCKKNMVINSPDPSDPDEAVLENKYGPFDRERHIDRIREVRWRLVCRECCVKNEKKHYDEVPKELLWSLSGAYPQGHELCKPRPNGRKGKNINN